MQECISTTPVEPQVSVIVPSYNTSAYIADALDSVFAQTYKNYEVIVINDGSPDTPVLETVLAPYMDRILYIKRGNGGVSAARNTGIRASSGTLIGLLDSDDIWKPNYLTDQVGYLLQHPEVDVVYGELVFFGGLLSGKSYMELLPSNGDVTFESIVRRKCHVAASVVARKEALVSTGLFDESLRICEDLDLWCRIVKAGYRIGYHRKLVMAYRRHDDSLSSEPVRLLRALIAVYEKFLREMDLTSHERQCVREEIEHFSGVVLFNEGKIAFNEGDFQTAARKLTEANQTLQQFRLRIIISLVRTCPRLLQWVYGLRVAKWKRTSAANAAM